MCGPALCRILTQDSHDGASPSSPQVPVRFLRRYAKDPVFPVACQSVGEILAICTQKSDAHPVPTPRGFLCNALGVHS